MASASYTKVEKKKNQRKSPFPSRKAILKATEIKRGPIGDPVTTAISALMNTQEEVKTFTGVKAVFNPLVLATVKSLFKSDRPYHFQGTRASTLSSNGSGIVQTSIGFSIANFDEKTPLQALFDEIRVRRFSFHLQGYLSSTSGMGVDIIAYNPSTLESSSPASYLQVARFPGSTICNGCANKGPYVISHSTPGREFGDITSDAASSSIPYGSWGAIWGYTVTSQTHTVSTAVWTFILKVDYELRCRS